MKNSTRLALLRNLTLFALISLAAEYAALIKMHHHCFWAATVLTLCLSIVGLWIIATRRSE